MNSLYAKLKNLINPEFSKDISSSEYIKIRFINFLCILGSGILLTYGISYLLVGDVIGSLVQFGSIGLLLFFFISVRVRKKSDVAATGLNILIYFFTGFNFLATEFGFTSYLWNYSIPIIIFFLNGKKNGLVVGIGFLIILAILSLFSTFGIVQIGLTTIEIEVFLLSLLFTFILSYLYQAVLEAIQHALGEQLKNIVISNQKLSETLNLNENFQKRLEVNLSESEGKNTDLQNQKLAMINLIEDLESEKNLSESRAETLKQFKEAVDNSNQHIIFTDPDGKILYANKAVNLTTGYSPDEIIGQRPSLWGKQMPREFYEQFWSIIKVNKLPFIGEFKNRRKNGDLYIAHAEVYPILDDNGQVKFFVGLERDITKEKEVDEMKTEFVSVASHQLKTPLTGIKWFLEILMNEKSGKLTIEQESLLTDIKENTERMIHLVNDLLNVSRIETGRKFAITKKPEDLVELIKEEITGIDLVSFRKKINLTTKDFPEKLELNLDRNKIKQVIYNLIDNAIKYSPDNTTITVGFEKQDDIWVEFYIQDQGYGIPADEQQNVFKKFFRASNAVKLQTDGTGLGLHIVNEIVKGHGGELRFKSEPGKGTTFYIKLPRN